MAYGMSKKRDFKIYCPMIDARRMEVFASFYDKSNNEIRGTQADIIEEHIYDNFLKEKILFFGDGSLKCKNIIVNPNAYFIDN